ncbi:hypothetical protein BKN49_20495 [Pseudomonas aeruginosa]|nr:hypothetical protein BKN49_20495 [Pseudomonas aeruginosa]
MRSTPLGTSWRGKSFRSGASWSDLPGEDVSVTDRVFALIDCNSFYCSCERLFRPDLARTPIVVLSNNDGAVVSRTPEAKKLGIAMGAPWHQIRRQFTAAGGQAFSSNYALY